MANKVLLKKSSVVDKIPTTSDLDYGEVAINYADELLYFKDSSNNIKKFAGTTKLENYLPSRFATSFLLMGS